MTREKLLVVLNKFDCTQVDYIEKLNEDITFEDLTDIRESFKNDCIKIYYDEFEKEFLENLTESNEIQLKNIQSYVEKEIFRLAYDKKWNKN
jgi:hypothetical protein